MTGRENVHLYPSPIVNASRMLNETLSVARTGLFSRVILCGTAQAGLSREELLSSGRRLDRVGSVVNSRKSSVLGRVREQVLWSRAVFKRYSGSDICVVNAHSVAVLPVCYLLSRRLHAKLIYDTHELETESVASHGMQRKIFKLIERLLIGKCDAVFVVNESIAEWYRERYTNLKPVVIRNIPNPSSVGVRVELRDLLSVPDDKRLYIHVGNITEGRSIEAILRAFASRTVRDHVVFLGSGELEPLVQEYALNHENIHRLPPVSPFDVHSYVAGCDVGFCLTESSCLSYELSLPNKAFAYARAGVPFFFTNAPEVTRLMGPEFKNWMVDNSAMNLAKAIADLSSDAIEEAKVQLTSLRLPTWDEEVVPMIATYFDLMGHAGESTIGKS
jgi:glycosyltransferase involved in cell wall biosynthesis